MCGKSVIECTVPGFSFSRSKPFGAAYAMLVHSEVVSDLVPNGVGDYLLEFGSRARHAFVRALIDGDAVGHREAVEDGTVGQRPALVEAEEPGARRLKFHDDGDVLHALPEALGDAAERGFDDAVEFVGREHGSLHTSEVCIVKLLADTCSTGILACIALYGPPSCEECRSMQPAVTKNNTGKNACTTRTANRAVSRL